ncbi:MAG: hypothetical protein ABSH50_11210 [Bryobacteraceae bacterium]|jgi:hypothetical protein
MHLVVSFAVYIAVSLAATIWAARRLERHGRIFLLDAFPGNARAADSVNRLLTAAFYLVALGDVLRTSWNGPAGGPGGFVELTCSLVGWFLVVLGILYFSCLWVLGRMRKRGNEQPRQGWSEGAPLGKVLD